MLPRCEESKTQRLYVKRFDIFARISETEILVQKKVLSYTFHTRNSFLLFDNYFQCFVEENINEKFSTAGLNWNFFNLIEVSEKQRFGIFENEGLYKGEA